MKRLLFDTTALLWWLVDDPRLGRAARAEIVDNETEVLVSMASLWEIVAHTREGKIQADIGEVWEAVNQAGLKILDLLPAHLVALAALPNHFTEPAHQLLVAQAVAEGATLLSPNPATKRYPVEFLPCLPLP